MKVLLVHGDLRAGGGAERFAHAIAQGLRDLGHAVGVLDIHGHRPAGGHLATPPALRLWHRLPLPRRPHLLGYALVCREVPRLVADYDCIAYTYGEGPEPGRPGFRLLHAPALFSQHPDLLACLGTRTDRKMRLALRQAYTRICRALARPAIEPASGFTTFANSHWTAKMARTQPGVRVDHVLYPQVTPPPKTGDIKRETFLFAALGRIVANKRLTEAVRIIACLRHRGIPARLHVMGRVDTCYGRRFVCRYRDHPFVTVTANASRAEIGALLQRASYGLHGYRSEHFGIAVGEMIAAGCLPFVFDGGGVCELVPDKTLRYRDAADAVRRIEFQVFRGTLARDAKIAELRQGKAYREAVNFASLLPAKLALALPPVERADHAVA